MSYKSKHTGKQVDEAVSKVLNGEVGGGVTPDWNAQEGEAGYIENRPFFSPIDEQEFLTWMDDNTIDEDLDGYNLIIKIGNFNSNRTKTYSVEASSEKKPFYFFYNSYRYTITYQGYNLRVLDESGRHDIDGVNVKIYNYESLDDNVKLLDSAYLSDVLKTTPQKLSDTDKNQALTNLGIDPVVWKYICNPLVIESGQSVPEELIGEFNEDEGDRYCLKYPYKNMYVVKVNYHRINPIGANIAGIELEGYVGDSPDAITSVWGCAYITENKKWFIDA